MKKSFQTTIKKALPASDLFAVSGHNKPTVFFRGLESEMQVLIGTMNRHRAIDPFTYRPVTQDEIGIEPVFSIKDELDRSAQVVKAAERSMTEHRNIAR